MYNYKIINHVSGCSFSYASSPRKKKGESIAIKILKKKTSWKNVLNFHECNTLKKTTKFITSKL